MSETRFSGSSPSTLAESQRPLLKQSLPFTEPQDRSKVSTIAGHPEVSKPRVVRDAPNGSKSMLDFAERQEPRKATAYGSIPRDGMSAILRRNAQPAIMISSSAPEVPTPTNTTLATHPRWLARIQQNAHSVLDHFNSQELFQGSNQTLGKPSPTPPSGQRA